LPPHSTELAYGDLKKRNMLALNDVGKYVEELKERVRRHADGASDA
jgi:hypothetical protein